MTVVRLCSCGDPAVWGAWCWTCAHMHDRGDGVEIVDD